MNVCLIDVDSKIPNLALMKASTWHKQRGDTVKLGYDPLFDHPDICYVSKIFDFSPEPDVLPDCEILRGGSGYSHRAAIDSGVPFMFSVAEPEYDHLDMLASGTGLYICGVQGSGKTWMACRIAKGWLSRGLGSVRFVSSVRLLTQINETYNNRSTSENQVLDTYSRYQLLIIDDLGKEVPSKWALSRLFTIFDTRYANAMPTIVTTQFGTTSLAKRMSESGDTETALAIVSRFREKYRAVDMGNHDRRAGQ